jgi:hypothetical protein
VRPSLVQDESPPLDVLPCVQRLPNEVNPRPLKCTAVITAKRDEIWAIGVVLYYPLAAPQVFDSITGQHAANPEYHKQRIKTWLQANPKSVGNEDVATFQLPTFKLVCPVSYMRIEKPARSIRCKHLQAFDLRSYIQAAVSAPPKRFWCCPICDQPCPPHWLLIDDIAEQVLAKEPEDVCEIAFRPDATWEVTERDDDDPGTDSDDDAPAAKPAAPAQKLPAQGGMKIAMNLGSISVKPTIEEEREKERAEKARKRELEEEGEFRAKKQLKNWLVAPFNG